MQTIKSTRDHQPTSVYFGCILNLEFDNNNNYYRCPLYLSKVSLVDLVIYLVHRDSTNLLHVVRRNLNISFKLLLLDIKEYPQNRAQVFPHPHPKGVTAKQILENKSSWNLFNFMIVNEFQPFFWGDASCTLILSCSLMICYKLKRQVQMYVFYTMFSAEVTSNLFQSNFKQSINHFGPRNFCVIKQPDEHIAEADLEWMRVLTFQSLQLIRRDLKHQSKREPLMNGLWQHRKELVNFRC